MRPDAARDNSARTDNARHDAPRRRPGRPPARRHRGGHPGTRPGPAAGGRSPARREPSELERAIEAALAVPAPPDTTFRALGLPAPLTAALAGEGIEAPFAIQARALPDALAGRDVLGRAQTGSGKTLAFGLPTLARLATGGPRRPSAPRGLVLVPTRELAKQVANALEPLGDSLGVTVTTVYGGASMERQITRLRRGVDIVVATPGRLIDLMERRACTLGQVEITVLDEADHMADLGFYPAVTRILDETPATGQRLLFSATLDRDVERLVTGYLKEPAVHAVAPTVDVATAADHQVFILPMAGKLAVAAELAGRPDRTLFFVRTKHGADRLAKQLTKAGAPSAAIHGNLNQNQRHRALASFAEGQPRVLVATDVAARGLHIDDVGLVVHFDPPHDHKDYLHRSGRTARAGATGTVVALVDPGQVADVARLHEAAGITPSSHHVEAGHPAVREVATAGTPIPPPPPAPEPAVTPARAVAGRRGKPGSARGQASGGAATRGGARQAPAHEFRAAAGRTRQSGQDRAGWSRPERGSAAADGAGGRRRRPGTTRGETTQARGAAPARGAARWERDTSGRGGAAARGPVPGNRGSAPAGRNPAAGAGRPAGGSRGQAGGGQRPARQGRAGHPGSGFRRAG